MFNLAPMKNNKKNMALGMNYGTATNRLKKMLLFNLADRLDLLSCFRCGNKIENETVLSVDHKKEWNGTPELFWDIKNIAFSHINCNINHGNTIIRKRDRWKHGDFGYRMRKCRCEICKKAHDRYR